MKEIVLTPNNSVCNINSSNFENINMDKIRSGQSFLYREGGCPSMVLDLRMKEDICSTSLQKALNTALVRYPYLTCKMVRKDGDFYLEKNPLPFILKETIKLSSLGSKDVNYHLIDVTYKGKSIYISYHHGLCDGRGIMPFVKTLIYYYCTNKYNKKFNIKDVRLADQPLLQGETA